MSNEQLENVPANTLKGRLSGAGAPDDLTFNAVLQAFGAFVATGTNGYARIPVVDSGGVRRNLLIQWGQTTSGAADASIAFPVSFGTAPRVVMSPGLSNTESNTLIGHHITAVSAGGFTHRIRFVTQSGGTGAASVGVPASTACTVRWIAVGI